MSPKRRGQRRGRCHQAVVRRHGSTDSNARREDFVAGPAFAVAGIPTAGGALRRAPDVLDGCGHSGWKDDLLTLAAPDLARSG
jgi:hypothetical protein